MAEILVVEDYPPMAAALVRLLTSEGHRVVREFTVAGALQHTVAFDHAVLDIDLPDGNGVDLAERLLERRCVSNIVFFTATHEVALLTRATRCGRVVDKSDGTRRLLECLGVSNPIAAREAKEPAARDCPNSRFVKHSDIFALQPILRLASPDC